MAPIRTEAQREDALTTAFCDILDLATDDPIRTCFEANDIKSIDYIMSMDRGVRSLTWKDGKNEMKLKEGQLFDLFSLQKYIIYRVQQAGRTTLDSDDIDDASYDGLQDFIQSGVVSSIIGLENSEKCETEISNLDKRVEPIDDHDKNHFLDEMNETNNNNHLKQKVRERFATASSSSLDRATLLGRDSRNHHDASEFLSVGGHSLSRIPECPNTRFSTSSEPGHCTRGVFWNPRGVEWVALSSRRMSLKEWLDAR